MKIKWKMTWKLEGHGSTSLAQALKPYFSHNPLERAETQTLNLEPKIINPKP